MTSATRGLAAVVAALAAVPVWLAPGLEPPASARQPAGTVEAVREVEFDDCTFRLVNNYAPEDGRQFVRTRQVRSEEFCRFGARNRSIRVRVCFEGGDGSPADCSDWLMPTSETAYSESVITGPAPRDSIHYVEIRGEVRRFDLAAPDPPPPPEPPPPPPTTPVPAPTSTSPAAKEPGPAATSPAGQRDDEAGATNPSQQWDAASQQHPDTTRYGLAAGLAGGGVALFGLGGTGIWLLRRHGSGAW